MHERYVLLPERLGFYLRKRGELDVLLDLRAWSGQLSFGPCDARLRFADLLRDRMRERPLLLRNGVGCDVRRRRGGLPVERSAKGSRGRLGARVEPVKP